MSDVAVWIVLFHLGLLGLNWPLLEIFRGALFEYLLVFWLLFVLLVARAARGDGAAPAGLSDRGRAGGGCSSRTSSSSSS